MKSSPLTRASATKRAGPPPCKHPLRGCLYEANWASPAHINNPLGDVDLTTTYELCRLSSIAVLSAGEVTGK